MIFIQSTLNWCAPALLAACWLAAALCLAEQRPAQVPVDVLSLQADATLDSSYRWRRTRSGWEDASRWFDKDRESNLIVLTARAIHPLLVAIFQITLVLAAMNRCSSGVTEPRSRETGRPVRLDAA